MPIILFYHIGKTAGSTIGNLFYKYETKETPGMISIDIKGNDGERQIESTNLKFDDFYNKSLKRELDVKLLYYVKQHGHHVKSFYQDIKKLKELKLIHNDNLFIFTILRNPLEHTISLYNYYNNVNVPTCSKEKITDTLRYNYQAHYLYNSTTFWRDNENYLNKKDTNKLLSYIDLYFDHVGIVDNLDYTLNIINNKFNTDLKITKKKNVTKKKTIRLSDLTEKEIEIIKKKTELDNYLYMKYKNKLESIHK